MDELKASDPEVKDQLEEKEETTEETTETTEETTETEDKEKETTEEQPQTFDKKGFYKSVFEQEFDDDEKAKEHYSSLKTRAEKAEQLEASIETEKAAAKKLVDDAETEFLKKYNLNENEIRRLQILKLYPDADPNLMTKVITTEYGDTYKKNPIEVLKTKLMLDDSDIFDTEDKALRQIYKQYGIDPEVLDDNGKVQIEDDTMLSMQKDAKAATKYFEEIRSKIPIPAKTDIAAEREKENKEKTENITRLQKQWKPTFEKLADKALTSIKFEREIEKDGKKSKQVTFEFAVDENYRKEVTKVLMEVDLKNLAEKGVEWSKEAEQKLIDKALSELQSRYISKNFDQILLARENQLAKEWADKDHEESHHPLKTREKTPPKITDKLKAAHEAVDDQIGKRY